VRKAIKISTRILLILLFIIFSIFALLSLSSIQTWIAQKAADQFSQKLHTKVSIKKIKISFFNKIEIDELYIEDQTKDTLFFGGKINASFNNYFFLKDTIVINEIGISNARINLFKNKDDWNYEFINKYFSNSSTTQKRNSTYNFEVKKLKLNNIRFNQIDSSSGEDFILALTEFESNVKKSDFNNQVLIFSNIKLKDPDFTHNDYHGTKTNQTHHTNKINNNTKKWNLFANDIKIINGSFKNEKETIRKPYTNLFDGLHLSFNSISGELKELSLINDTLRANISMSANEKSGFEIKKICADFTFTPHIMEFKNLDAQTNKSHLRNYYSMSFDSFLTDMNDFENKVNLVGHFDSSVVSTDDISFFTPEISNWKRNFIVRADANGTLNNLYSKNTTVQSNNTILKGDLHLLNMTSLDQLYINWKSKESKTTINELASFVPSINNIEGIQIKKLGDILFSGNFEGKINNFIVSGDLKSNLGSIHENLNFNLKDSKLPIYKGFLSTNNFNINGLFNNPILGHLSIKGDISGEGFNSKTLNTYFNGHIDQFGFNKYDYRNIDINATFKKNEFNGQLLVNDSSLKIDGLNGKIKINDGNLDFNLFGDLKFADLKKLNISDKEITTKGFFDLNFKGNNIDDFLGEARVFNSELNYDNKNFKIDSLIISSEFTNERKQLFIQSNDLTANLNGDFKLLELNKTFSYFLHHYFPSYINKPTKALHNQDFSFDIQTKKINPYLQFIDSRLSDGNYSSIHGNLNLKENNLSLDAKIPNLGFDGKSFTNIDFNSNGNADTLTTLIKVGDITILDSTHLPNTSLFIKTSNDNSTVQLNTSSYNSFNDATINANVETFKNGVAISFQPSTFYINENLWSIKQDGQLTINENKLDVKNISITHNDQSVIINKDSLNESLTVKMEGIVMEDFIPFLFKNPSITGRLSGVAKITNVISNPTISFTGKSDSLYIENEKIGNLELSANANTSTGIINYHGNNKDSTNIYTINGAYNYKDTSEKSIYANLDGKLFNLSILTPYLNDVFDKIEGEATTNLTITGNNDHQYLTGDAIIKNGIIKSIFTQVPYLLKNQKIHFGKDSICLDNITISDKQKNTASLNGNISHVFFDAFKFQDLRLESQKISLLNTTKKDFNQFYGNVIGKVKMNLNGPLSNLIMNIEGAPNLLDTSHFYIQTTEGQESKVIDYIDFVKFGSLQGDAPSNETVNFKLNLNIEANPACKVDVILDEETGDVIKGQGNGIINITTGNIEPLKIRGNYTLTKGEYNFNFQTFFQKPFTLNTGTITWNGDPYQANINIDADYLAKNVDISSLTSSGSFKQKEDIKIIAHLTGVLQKPTVKFEFQLMDKSDAKRDDIFVKRLADFKNNENEMNKQVASLLLFNSFISGEQNFLSQGNATTLFTNTIGGMMSNLLTNFLNRELEKATKGILSTYVDINPTLDLQKSASQLQANVRAGLKISLHKRLDLLVGGNLDYNNPTYTQQLEKKGLLTPDINIEWLINKDGTLRVVGFNKSSIDLSLNQRNRSGLQLSFRKDANKLSDIFKSKKKNQ